MPIAQTWRDRYEAAKHPRTDAEKAAGLSLIQRDVLRALLSYAPEPGQLAQPSPEDLADVASCTVRAVHRALEKAKAAGLIGEVWP